MPVILWFVGACTVAAKVGDPCPTVVINEVMTASDSFLLPGEDSTSDWFELRNVSKQPADLSGFRLIGHTDEDNAFVLPEAFSVPGQGLALFIAGTFEDPASETPIVGFDFNGDGDSLELRAAEAEIECDSVFIPDQHHGFSWQRNPAAKPGSDSTWCDSLVPSPGAPNAECLCEATDAC
ncbi:hypothetical protein LBMAG42_40520 [Deltaproteobacteria bacterium]|nr:hypothetical protein LBMAG42_40520 [Deltaproteobacteria bacterium]